MRTATTPEDPVLAAAPQLRDASNLVPLAGAVKLLPRSDRLTLELQLASSADDDWRDSDLVSELGLAGASRNRQRHDHSHTQHGSILSDAHRGVHAAGWRPQDPAPPREP